MGFFEFATVAVVFGCGTGVILTVVDKIFGGKNKAMAAELKSTQERAHVLEAQLIDAHRQNHQLQKQLEWHTKMLETQERLMHRLADGERDAVRPVAGALR
jgi:uncharacterized membrane protein (DUF106 family)